VLGCRIVPSQAKPSQAKPFALQVLAAAGMLALFPDIDF
jgi:hypothetical protein